MTGVLLYISAWVLSMFCSGTETAFSACSRVRVAASRKNSTRALWFLGKPSRYLVTILVGNNVAMVLASSIAQGWGASLGGAWKLVFAVFTALFLLVFAEMVPKQLALFRSNVITVASAPVLNVIRVMLYPLIAVASFVSRSISGDSEEGRFFESREEVKGLLVSSGGRQGHLASAVIALGHTGVGDFSRPLSDYPSVAAGCTRQEAVTVLRNSGRNFLLVWEEPGVTLTGAVRGAVLVRWNGEGSITSIVSGLPSYYPSYPALRILPGLRRSGAVAAVILDGMGQPSRLITPGAILTHLIPDEQND